MIQDSVSLFKNVLTWALALLFAQGLFAQDGSKIYLVVVDGRQGRYSTGVKAYEVFRIAKKLGGWWSTRMDGGGSAGMWVWNASSASGAIVSKPSDTNGERSCLTYILIREK